MRSRQRVKWAQLRVFAISIVAIAILSVLLYLLTGGTLFTEKTRLFLYVPDATGIAEGSPVRVNGITVGKVTSVALSGSRDPKRVVRLTLTIERNSLPMIPVGSSAELGTDTLIGDKFVDITGRGRGPSPPNSELPYEAPTDLFKTLDFAQFEARLREMETILNDIEAGRGRVGQFVTGTKMYVDLQRQLGLMERAVRSAASTTDGFGREVYTERLYRQLMAPLTDFDQALARLQSGQGAGSWLRDSGQHDRWVSAARGMRESIADLRAARFVQSDELWVSVNRSLVSLARSVDEINYGPLFAAPQTYESLNGFARELAETVKDFRGNPKKYLRIKVF
jgi:phospholipid/cholesterol/gamma-HCH transport system substrate-binding protein